MTTFLDFYKGASIYEVSEVDPSEGEPLTAKLIAEAVLPNHPNVKVDFIEEAATQEDAREKIEKSIDQYLNEHNIAQFEKDLLIDNKD